MPANRHVAKLEASVGYVVADMARRAALRRGRLATSRLGSIVPVFAESDVQDNLAVARAGKLTPTPSRSPSTATCSPPSRPPASFLRVFGELLDEANATRANQHGKGPGQR